MEIYNIDLERQLLAGVIRNPDAFVDIDSYIDESDFRNKLHQTLFGVIRQTIRNGQKIDKFTLSQKINQLSLSFEDKISSVLDYINEICLAQVSHKVVRQYAEELKTVSLRRELAYCGDELSRAMYENPNYSPEDLIKLADEIYNRSISTYVFENDEPENIFEGLTEELEQRALNPVEEIGLEGPYERLNQMYGSLFRPGNITTICSRSGSGKTSLLNDACFKMASRYNIPVLHFDNGEMLKGELQNRIVASLSGVPLYLIETGKYGSNPEFVERVKRAARSYEARQFFYRNVAGKSVDEMLSMIRRFHMKLIGRNPELRGAPIPLLFCFDYIKSTSEASPANRAEWETIGIMVTKFKDFISKELQIPMITAVQSNRSGVVTGRTSANVIDDESIFSGGDRTVFFSSHAFILRKKTSDELAAENGRYGTHKLINVKARHLGRDVRRAIDLVRTGDGSLRHNYVNLEINNFGVTELGDLRDQEAELSRMDISTNDDDFDIAL